MTIAAVSGFAGNGKTSLIKAVSKFIRNVTVLGETARRVAPIIASLPGNLAENQVAFQAAIIGAEVERLCHLESLRNRGGNGVVLCDRTVFDNVIFAEMNGVIDSRLGEELVERIIHIMESLNLCYDVVFLMDALDDDAVARALRDPLRRVTIGSSAEVFRERERFFLERIDEVLHYAVRRGVVKRYTAIPSFSNGGDDALMAFVEVASALTRAVQEV